MALRRPVKQQVVPVRPISFNRQHPTEYESNVNPNEENKIVSMYSDAMKAVIEISLEIVIERVIVMPQVEYVEIRKNHFDL
jgi:hypothetical protein